MQTPPIRLLFASVERDLLERLDEVNETLFIEIIGIGAFVQARDQQYASCYAELAGRPSRHACEG